MKPNLCATIKSDEQIEAYLKEDGFGYVSYKIDGVRAIVDGNMFMSRSLKPLPNRAVQAALSGNIFDGLDGELVVGDRFAGDVFRRSSSALMSHDGEPDWTFWVFDLQSPEDRFFERIEYYAELVRLGANPRVKVLEQKIVRTVAEVNAFEVEALKLGAEGVIYCRPYAVYKEGRSTPKQGGKCKIKRFVDSEMIVTGVEELMRNQNEAEMNELGYMARGHSKAGMVPGGTMGKLIGTDIHTGVEVKLGTGFTAAERDEIWAGRDLEIGKIWKYKHFPVGVKDKARHPVALGRRAPGDMSPTKVVEAMKKVSAKMQGDLFDG